MESAIAPNRPNFLSPGEIQLTRESAIALLPQKSEIHTVQRMLGWAGCDMDREDVAVAIRDHGAGLSDECPFDEHRLVVCTYGRRTFVEVDPVRLASLKSLIESERVS